MSMLNRSLPIVLVTAALAVVAACASEDPGGSGGDSGGKADGTVPELQLTTSQRDTLVHKGATCPFMRTAVNDKRVRIRGAIDKPLGDTGDVIHLGNAGGGDLGKVLEFFAHINHNRLNGPGGLTETPVPDNTFGIWFPGSQGAHPGHSGILMGDPGDATSGRFTAERLTRLTSDYSTLYPDGKRYISREQIGAFIADNVGNDPTSRGFDLAGMQALSTQLADLARRAAENDPNLLKDVLHLLVTGNDLVNSSGELSLLFTRFADGTDVSGHPVISTGAVESLFRDGVFPAGWDQHPARATDWVWNTLAIARSAILTSWGF